MVKPTPSYVSQSRIHPTVNGHDFSLVTLPGTFSASGLDVGNHLLMKSITAEDGEHVLDLCCGYGSLGVYVVQIANCEIWLSDDNKVATNCAEASLQASDIDGKVVTANCVDGVAGQTFDRILCNPPTHAGEDALDDEVASVLENAARRAEGNDRKTVQARDL
ncbi:16S rRNA (guanine1207-N2)-methyltransferase [Haladaptatus litoreus]|uniref:16S rRNA (Guanine1207-N2)-methyltransferase n=1 Tax=Haladaptatus litoreus TaxID=553468 RepID=A0A1N7F3S4_9EURY|nr:16S rRNA (guanine1207-N2)-methyltransferase [Haladaptatus litoreus]